MATVLRCKFCGKLLRLASADGVVSVSCPHCHREVPVSSQGEPNGGVRAGLAEESASGAMGQAESGSGTGQSQFLTVVTGPSDVGRRVALPGAGRLAIGSDKATWLHLEGGQVDSVHCLLESESGEDGWRVVNRSERTGTWVNGRAVAQSPVRAGDVIRLGPYELRMEDGGARAAEQAETSVSPGGAEAVVEPQFPRLMASRFDIACLVVVLVALLDGAYHVLLLFLRQWQEPVFRVVAGAVPTVLMLQLALFLVSGGARRRVVVVVGLVVLALVDVCVLRPPVYGGFLLRCMLAGGVGLMTAREPSPVAVASGNVISWTAVGCYALGLIWAVWSL
jgi:phage FluMu protein Com